ncbi:type II DNA topoisomerase, partial [Nadsonia fulvescens var. elongata DSM 6958]
MSDISDDDFIIDDNDSDFVIDEPVIKPAAKKKNIVGAKRAPLATKKTPVAKKAKTTTKPIIRKSPFDIIPETTPIPVPLLNSASTPPVDYEAPNNNAVDIEKSASSTYQKLTQLEHILKRPDTYIGSVEPTDQQMWVYDETANSMVWKSVTIVPGLYKIFDEILVNAADNKIRDPAMDELRVDIDVENNTVSIFNNGKGIPIQMHEKENMYIPELIFGNLLTSSNYDDDQKKVTGGRNGYGAKLCNIFSTEFILETADMATNLVYKQVWSGNMSKVTTPRITTPKKPTQYTKIIFKPDLKLFNMTKIDTDLVSVMMRRVYDLAGTNSKVKVYLNKERLKVKDFKSYVEMFLKAMAKAEYEQNGLVADEAALAALPKPKIVHEIINDRWEVAFGVSDGNFNQVSFVNSIATTSGGTHVNYIADQLTTKILEHVKKKAKSAQLRISQIRGNMFLFVNCLIENPAFTSQTKEQLTTKVSAFGSKCVLPEDFVKKVLKTSIVDSVMEIASRNADKDLKKTDGNRKKRLTGFVNLEDANKAGTREGYKCTLILTEGISALSLAVAGLAVVGRDYYGAYPLRGKLLNVREASHDQIMKNNEIQAIKQIMGLQHKKHYTSTNELRYGHIMIMTDQDHDGSHIKGLIINFLDSSFPGLLEIPGFLVEFVTPIVKVSIKRGNRIVKVIPFFSMPEFEYWRDTEGRNCSWTHKYYKGLGSSKPEESREYFSQLDNHFKTFHALQNGDQELIELAFSKKKTDHRKDWLRNFQPGTHLDHEITEIPISEFINKELILFSMADNIRSIPSVLDGFKPGQRKVLYACFKRNLKSEIKVGSLAAYAVEHTGYHHGEQSLVQTIIGLAQDFVGSNNLYLLNPNGSFGTRATGGKDAAAARYIFTELNELTRKIFPISDDPLLNYLMDDKDTVEPEWYTPIIPMVLVNGAEGIGTGWSTNIPCYNPLEIVDNLRKLMAGEEMVSLSPWYRGWNGILEPMGPERFRTSGIINKIDDNTIEITELPIKMWTISMKEFLLNNIKKDRNDSGWIEDMTEDHGIGIRFVVKLTEAEMRKTESIGFYERFKLNMSISLSNMIAFDAQNRIKKYASPEEIISDFYPIRLDFYQRRKDNLTNQLQNQLEKLSQQARFVKMIIEKELVVTKRKRDEIVKELQTLEFPRIGKDGIPVFSRIADDEVELGDAEEDDDGLSRKQRILISDFDYLLGMPIWSLTYERYEKLLKERNGKETELIALLRLSAKDLWNIDLDDFVKGWNNFMEFDHEKRSSLIPKKKSTAKKGRKTKVDDDDFAPGATKKKKTAVK